jgi:hypothetical protein
MAKNEQQPLSETNEEAPFNNQTGRIWGCNHELSQTRGLNLIVDSEINEELRLVCASSNCRKYESTYFTVYYINYHDYLKVGSSLLFRKFSDYLFQQLGFSEQLTLKKAS